MEASPRRIDRSQYPEAVQKAADYLSEQFQEGYVLPARARFNTDGEMVEDDPTQPPGTFGFFIPDVQGTPTGLRDDDWPWVIYANTARQAYYAQIGED